MKIILNLPNLSERKLELVQDNIEAAVKVSTNPLSKEIANLVIKTLDYSPHDVAFKDLVFFQSQYADQLNSLLTNISEANFDFDRDIFFLAFYLHILQFEALSLKNSFGSDEIELGSFLETNFVRFPSDLQQRIRYLSYKLGADIAKKRILNFANEKLGEIQSEFTSINSAVAMIQGWDSNLGGWEKKVAEQERKLKDQLVKLNFVGLSKAFQNLISEKNWEKRIHALISFVLGIMLAAAPILIVLLNKNYPEYVSLNNVHTIGPMAALEFVIFYLFRVALHNYSSAKAQLLQLKLRFELCAFVEGYAEFIEPLRQKGGTDTLAKFESIVFAGISPDPQNVPSQFDGLDNILKLIKATKAE